MDAGLGHRGIEIVMPDRRAYAARPIAKGSGVEAAAHAKQAGIDVKAAGERKEWAADPVAAAAQAMARGKEALRDRLGEFVGNVFYGTLLKQMDQSSLKGKYFHGGRGEEAFKSQLHLEMSSRLGRSEQNAVVNRLYESFRRRIELGEESLSQSSAAPGGMEAVS